MTMNTYLSTGKVFIIALMSILSLNTFSKPKPLRSQTAGCAIPGSKAELDINNVRAVMLNAGDQWWDLNNAGYEVPKGSGKHSIFSGALWIGGLDGGLMRVAAQTYRSSNQSDYWPGPLDTVDGKIDSATCRKYDRHFKINCADIETFKTSGKTTAGILDWPGNGEGSQPRYLAPFVDKNGDGLYKTSDGDYPDIRGDQAIWWAINDAGNTHTVGNTGALGVTVKCMAYAFQTSDDYNNMTFYNYTISNHSNTTYESTYAGIFVDTDLGYGFDDYLGCDIGKNTGYVYNGDDNDDPDFRGYGTTPPALGVRVLKGPYAPLNDGIDNDNDGSTDEENEMILMSNFTYFLNTGNAQGNPNTGDHFYNYLQSIWKDGTHMTYGGTGYDPISSDNFNYAFPGTSAGNNRPEWSEASAKTIPGDRRFILSTGGFKFLPGQLLTLDHAVVWARAETGGAKASVDKMLQASNLAQTLAENNFKITGHNCNSFGTGVSNPPHQNMALKIYPNPLKKTTTLQWGNDSGMNCKLAIYNAEGLLIRKEDSIQNGNYILERGELKKGIYIVNITTNTSVMSAKLLVQ